MRSLPLFKGLYWLMLLNFLVKPLWIFFIDREVQNQLGHEVYGKYFSIFNLSIILLFLADAGLSNLINRQIATNASLDVIPFLRIKILLSFLYMTVMVVVALAWDIQDWTVVLYIMAIHLLTSFFIFLRAIVTARQHFVADAWFSVIDKMIVIILAAGFIYWPGFVGSISLLLFLQVQLAGSFLAFIFVMGFLINRKFFHSSANKYSSRGILLSTLPFTIIILLMGIHYRADAFLLERIHSQGAMQAGIYAMGYRLLDAGNMVGYLAASFLVPFIARNQNDSALVNRVVLNLRHILVLFGMALAIFTWMFASWIQDLLYHSNEDFYTDVIRYCMAVLPAYLMIHIYGSLLTATGRFRSFIMILSIAVALNLVLNLVLIPDYGALGCCYAALASQYFAALSCTIAATKKQQMNFNWPSFLFYLAAAIVMAVFFYFSKLVIINVWLILASAVAVMLILLAAKARYIKKLFVSP